MEGDAGGRQGADATHESGRFRCPYCNSYEVARLFVATLNMDSCECEACGARWDEETTTGQYRGRAKRSSVLLPREN